jgi:hypothetical protein
MARAAAGAVLIIGLLSMGAAAAPASSEKPPASRDRPPVASEKPAAASDRWGPMVVGTDDLGPGAKPKSASPAVPAAKIAPEIRLDEKSRTVTVPATFTRAKGVLEWLLASGNKHATASVLVTARSARDLAAALAKVGLTPGVRPEPVGEDRATRPAGQALEITVVARAADGKVARTPAEKFLAAKSSGEPLGPGGWVYVGPQVLREGDVDILVTELSGSIATTNLRDATAVIYWVGESDDRQPYVTAFYASSQPLPAEGTAVEVEIRAAPPAAPGAPPERRKNAAATEG